LSKNRGDARVTHVVAISIADRHQTNDAMDTIGRFCTDLVAHGLGSGRSTSLGSGGIVDDDGMAVWRISSIRDLGARLNHLPDDSLERFDLVAHSGTHGDTLDVHVGTEWLSESLGLRAIDLLRDKLARPQGDLFAPPMVRIVSCLSGLQEELLRGLAKALRGVAVMATKGEPAHYYPKMTVDPCQEVLSFPWGPTREWRVVRYVDGDYASADGRGRFPTIKPEEVGRWYEALRRIVPKDREPLPKAALRIDEASSGGKFVADGRCVSFEYAGDDGERWDSEISHGFLGPEDDFLVVSLRREPDWLIPIESTNRKEDEMTTTRIYPLHDEEGGKKTDSYKWRQVRIISESDTRVTIEILVEDESKKKIEQVWFDVHDHFDPDVLWYSEYLSSLVVKRPAEGETTEGLLLVNTHHLVGVKNDASLDAALEVLKVVPKWPKNTGTKLKGS
jgi:hypothetical protein